LEQKKIYGKSSFDREYKPYNERIKKMENKKIAIESESNLNLKKQNDHNKETNISKSQIVLEIKQQQQENGKTQQINNNKTVESESNLDLKKQNNYNKEINILKPQIILEIKQQQQENEKTQQIDNNKKTKSKLKPKNINIDDDSFLLLFDDV